MELIDQIIAWLLDTIGHWGYLGVFILTAMESSIFPVPSELVMIPAGYLATLGKFDFLVLNIIAVIASIVGALFNYFLALWLGRGFFVKYGKYFGITEEHLDKVDAFFHRHGDISTFIGRFIPVVRHLISIPAGFAQMNIFTFSIYTGIGSGIWCFILASIGYIAGSNEEIKGQLLKQTWIFVIVLIIVILVGYILFLLTLKAEERLFHTNIKDYRKINTSNQRYILITDYDTKFKIRDNIGLFSDNYEKDIKWFKIRSMFMFHNDKRLNLLYRNIFSSHKIEEINEIKVDISDPKNQRKRFVVMILQ